MLGVQGVRAACGGLCAAALPWIVPLGFHARAPVFGAKWQVNDRHSTVDILAGPALGGVEYGYGLVQTYTELVTAGHIH